MSEAAPGTGDDPVFATASRAELAQSVRELIDACMTVTDTSDTDLVAAARAVRAVTASLVPDDEPDNEPDDENARGRRLTAGRTGGPRHHGEYLPRSPVVGEASPMSPRIDWHIVDGRCHATGTFGAAYEGPPGYVHGGMIALAFDEVLGIVNIANGCPGMTGTLTVRYRRPTPLYREVRFEAWVEHVDAHPDANPHDQPHDSRQNDRRKVRSRAVLHAGDTLCAEADGLFIQPRPELAIEYFGHPMGG